MSEPSRSDLIVFVSPSEAGISVGGERDYGKVKDFFTRSRQDVAEEWEVMIKQLDDITSRLSSARGEFQLQEVQFQLGFSAEGQIGFIAKAGATASVTVTFVRPAGEGG